MSRAHRILAAAALALALSSGPAALPAGAGLLGSSGAGFTPRVPVSGFAMPAWFDPSRFHMTTSVSVGSTGFGGGMDALQVTSFSYAFKAPVWMSVSLGNAWGPNAAGNSSFFLEGFNLRYQPSPTMQFQIQYRDLRSPLQWSDRGYGYGAWGW